MVFRASAKVIFKMDRIFIMVLVFMANETAEVNVTIGMEQFLSLFFV